MTKASADLIILLLCRSGLGALIAHLLRAFGNHALLFFEALTGNLLPLLEASLGRILLASLLLASSGRQRLGRRTGRRLLSAALFICPTLCFRILCGLVLLVLIGHCGLLWLKEKRTALLPPAILLASLSRRYKSGPHWCYHQH
jgi:hypothetical protein